MDGQLLASGAVGGEPRERETVGGPDVADAGFGQALMELIDDAAKAAGARGRAAVLPSSACGRFSWSRPLPGRRI
jgi:hypothetical protein